MKIDDFLSKLDKVRGSHGRFSAVCPAHPDRNPSLSVTELPDGRILVHCHAGCSVEEILSAVGMDWEALMPECLGEFKPVKRPWSASQLLRALSFHAILVSLAAADLASGKPLSEADKDKLFAIAGELEDASRGLA